MRRMSALLNTLPVTDCRLVMRMGRPTSGMYSHMLSPVLSVVRPLSLGGERNSATTLSDTAGTPAKRQSGKARPTLSRLAIIVRGADTARPELAPLAAGLGFSVQVIDEREALNSDASEYGGSGVGNLGRVVAEELDPGLGQLMGLVEHRHLDARQQLGHAAVAQSHVGEEQVMVHHHHVERRVRPRER